MGNSKRWCLSYDQSDFFWELGRSALLATVKDWDPGDGRHWLPLSFFFLLSGAGHVLPPDAQWGFYHGIPGRPICGPTKPCCAYGNYMHVLQLDEVRMEEGHLS